ncbi:MAG TPA: hypothetical protein VFA15_02165, partial [Nitrososphaera sp.]|nr:hypothetical protein [Nitrososphaera sp.]
VVPTAESAQTIPKPLISQGLDANQAYTRCFYKGASRGNFYTVGKTGTIHVLSFLLSDRCSSPFIAPIGELVPIPREEQRISLLRKFSEFAGFGIIAFVFISLQALVCYVFENLNESAFSVHTRLISAILAVQSQIFPSRRFHREKDSTAARHRFACIDRVRASGCDGKRPGLPSRPSL